MRRAMPADGQSFLGSTAFCRALGRLGCPWAHIARACLAGAASPFLGARLPCPIGAGVSLQLHLGPCLPCLRGPRRQFPVRAAHLWHFCGTARPAPLRLPAAWRALLPRRAPQYCVLRSRKWRRRQCGAKPATRSNHWPYSTLDRPSRSTPTLPPKRLGVCAHRLAWLNRARGAQASHFRK